MLSDSDWQKIENMIGIFCTLEEVCHVMGIDRLTLKELVMKKYVLGLDEYVKKHTAKAAESLRAAMLRKANEGSTQMQIWLSKNYLGMSDKVQHSGIEIIKSEYEVIESQLNTSTSKVSN